MDELTCRDAFLYEMIKKFSFTELKGDGGTLGVTLTLRSCAYSMYASSQDPHAAGNRDVYRKSGDEDTGGFDVICYDSL